MNTADMKLRVDEFWQAFNRGEPEAALALMSEDVVFTVTGTTPVSGANEGKASVGAHFRRFATLVDAGAQMAVRELIAEGDTVVCISDGTMRSTGTGAEYNNSYAFIFSFGQGRIAAVTEFLNTALVETALFGKSIA